MADGYLCRVGDQWNLYMPIIEDAASFIEIMFAGLKDHPFVFDSQSMTADRTSYFDRVLRREVADNLFFVCKGGFSSL